MEGSLLIQATPQPINSKTSPTTDHPSGKSIAPMMTAKASTHPRDSTTISNREEAEVQGKTTMAPTETTEESSGTTEDPSQSASSTRLKHPSSMSLTKRTSQRTSMEPKFSKSNESHPNEYLHFQCVFYLHNFIIIKLTLIIYKLLIF
jgi:hypothetical protein